MNGNATRVRHRTNTAGGSSGSPSFDGNWNLLALHHTGDPSFLTMPKYNQGVMIDAIRCAKIALDRKLSGPIVGPSSYFFKTPPKQFRDDICREKVESYIKGESNE